VKTLADPGTPGLSALLCKLTGILEQDDVRGPHDCLQLKVLEPPSCRYLDCERVMSSKGLLGTTGPSPGTMGSWSFSILTRLFPEPLELLPPLLSGDKVPAWPLSQSRLASSSWLPSPSPFPDRACIVCAQVSDTMRHFSEWLHKLSHCCPCFMVPAQTPSQSRLASSFFAGVPATLLKGACVGCMGILRMAFQASKWGEQLMLRRCKSAAQGRPGCMLHTTVP
jgi:hypothetical protein